jgi:tetratricopeptide (TPR) repeat protein
MLAILTAISLLLGYTAYGVKEAVLLRMSFRVEPGPGTLQSVQATDTAFDVEVTESSASRTDAARKAFARGQALFKDGRYLQASEEYRQSIAAVPTLSATLNRGVALRYVPDYSAAESVLRSGLRASSEQHRQRFEAHFRLYLSSVLIGEGRHQEGKAVALTALSIYEQLDDALGQANSHLNIGNVKITEGHADEALAQWREAERLFLEARNSLGQANTTNNIAGTHIRHLGYSKAAEEFALALSLYRHVGNRTGISRASLGLAIVDYAQGRWEQSLATLQRILADAVERGDREFQNAALAWISANREELGDYPSAVKAATAAVHIAQELGSLDDEGFDRVTLGSVYRHLGQLREAEKHLKLGLSCYEKSQNQGGVALVLLELGMLALARHDATQGEELFQSALRIAESNDSPALRLVALTGLGFVEAERGRDDRALQYLLPAQAVFRRVGVRSEPVRDAERLIILLRGRASSRR